MPDALADALTVLAWIAVIAVAASLVAAAIAAASWINQRRKEDR